MKLNKHTIALLAVAGGFGFYALAGFMVLPSIAEKKLPDLIQELTGQQPKLQAIRLNPFNFSLEVDSFELPAADGKPLLGFAKLAVDFEAWESLRSGAIVFNKVALSSPNFAIERRADGRFNFDDLLPKPQVTADGDDGEGANPLQLLIHALTLENGQASWLDATIGEGGKETILPINLTVAELSTQTNSSSTLELNLALASGGTLNWHGDFQLAPLNSNGHMQLDNLALPAVWRLFLQQLLPLAIAEGQLSLQTDYQMRNGEQGVQLQISNAAIDVKQLNLTAKTQADSLIAIPSLGVQGVAVDLAKQEVSVGLVSSSDAVIKAWLENDGTLNYQALFANQSSQTAQVTPPPAEEASPTKPWLIKLNELALNNYQIQFSDRSQRRPVDITLSELNCKLQNFNSAEKGKLPLQFSSRFNKAGALSVNGDISPEPFVAELALDVRDIYLKTFQSYIDPFVGLDLVDGAFGGKGRLSLKSAEELQIGFQGEAKIDHLITRDKVKNKDFAKWASLEVSEMAIDLPQQVFKFGRIVFDQPYFRFMIKKDGTTNIDDILLEPTDVNAGAKPAKTEVKAVVAAKSAAGRKESPSDPTISIGKVEVKQGKSDFADYSLILPFVAEMNSLNGEVEGFSSNTDDAAKLKLKGKVYDMATVAIKGQYQFRSNDSDIALNFSHMPLPLVTPYMAEFAGYKIEKGQMALDLEYTIKRGQLVAQNKILIDQLTLGEKVENPKAVSLPLELAIALLKDGDGKINLDFPISGSLEDPQFSVGSLVADVLVNLVTKVASAPFKAIASLFDGDEDLSTVAFVAGGSELAQAEIAKLSQIGQALKEKPELALEVKGLAYQVQDWPSLRSEVVLEVLKKMKSGELRDKGEQIRSEYIELSDSDYKRLLAKFYAEVFPQEIDYGLLGKPRMKNNPDVEFYTTARMQLEAIMQPEPQRLNDLAVRRANNIAKYLAEQAGVDKGRIYLLATDVRNGSVGEPVTATLSLNVRR